MGAWIETDMGDSPESAGLVAPLVGAWIETQVEAALLDSLKVAPLVGAWIETFDATFLRKCP